jgi:hypothetical protein
VPAGEKASDCQRMTIRLPEDVRDDLEVAGELLVQIALHLLLANQPAYARQEYSQPVHDMCHELWKGRATIAVALTANGLAVGCVAAFGVTGYSVRSYSALDPQTRSR